MDNDIRHVKNSHGEDTNEKYPVTAEDQKLIPDIIKNYDDVLYVENDGKKGIYYVKRHNGVTYYLEAIINQGRTLSNKQMIKVPTGTIPNIAGLKDAINKKWNIDSVPDDSKIPQMYVQDVENNYVPDNNIPQSDNVVNNQYMQGGENNSKGFPHTLTAEQNEAYNEAMTNLINIANDMGIDLSHAFDGVNAMNLTVEDVANISESLKKVFSGNSQVQPYLTALDNISGLNNFADNGIMNTNKNIFANLPEIEQRDVMDYKSSESYKINESLYSGRELTNEENEFVANLNNALRILKYTAQMDEILKRLAIMPKEKYYLKQNHYSL